MQLLKSTATDTNDPLELGPAVPTPPPPTPTPASVPPSLHGLALDPDYYVTSRERIELRLESVVCGFHSLAPPPRKKGLLDSYHQKYYLE